MTTKTFAYGTLQQTTDTWILVRDHVIPIDAPVIDDSLEHKMVSIVGTMGVPPTAPGITKLIAEKIVSHEAIARRAYEISQSGDGESSDANWFRAERELLAL